MHRWCGTMGKQSNGNGTITTTNRFTSNYNAVAGWFDAELINGAEG